MISNFLLVFFRKCPSAGSRKKIRKVLSEAMKARESSVEVGTCAIETLDDNTKTLDNTTTKGPEKDAKTICWFCHADVSNMKNCICVGCKKVRTTLSLVNKSSLMIVKSCTENQKSESNTCQNDHVQSKKDFIFSNFQARYCSFECQGFDWARHGDYCVAVQEKIKKKKEAKKSQKESL